MAESVLKRVKVEDGSKFIGAVFLYMGLGLLITAIVATGFGFLWTSLLAVDYTAQTINYDNYMLYFWVMIGAGIAQIACIIWIQVGVFKGSGRLLLIPYSIYAIIMGLFVSSFTVFMPFYEIGIVFGITCVAFAGMALIGLLTKSKLNWMGIVGFGILIGSSFIIMFNLIWMWIFPATFLTMYWIISFAIFFAMIFITIWDVRRLKDIAKSDAANESTALYCAFNLYVDFMYILIRLLSIVAISRR